MRNRIKLEKKKIEMGRKITPDLWQEDEDGRQREEDERKENETKGEGCDEATEITKREEEEREEEEVLLSAWGGRNGWILLAEEPPAASYLLAFVNSRHIS